MNEVVLFVHEKCVNMELHKNIMNSLWLCNTFEMLWGFK